MSTSGPTTETPTSAETPAEPQPFAERFSDGLQNVIKVLVGSNFALCEHHALPFYGHAYIGYIPHEHIIGISKLTRLVRLFAKRFTVQERLGQQIADTLDTMLEQHGVAVYIDAHHLCTEMRGVRESTPLTRTTFWRGEYDSNSSLRVEFLLACGAEL
jgi:GTP cyclohydrolase IA